MSTHISELHQDPRNARLHNPRNLDMIERSLQEVGAARSIVIDENNRILAGNGTIEAAGNAGIENVRIIESDGHEIIAVRRTGLTEEQKTKLALYDNRTAELASWDKDVIAELNEEVDLSRLWSKGEMERLLSEIQTDDGFGDGKEYDESITDGEDLMCKFKIVIPNQDSDSFEIRLDELLRQFPKAKKEKSL